MPATINVGQTSTATIQGSDQFGQPFAVAGLAIAYVPSDPQNVTLAPVGADGSDIITGVAPDASESIGANITRADGVVIQASADVLTINAAPVPVLTTAKVVLT